MIVNKLCLLDVDIEEFTDSVHDGEVFEVCFTRKGNGSLCKMGTISRSTATICFVSR